MARYEFKLPDIGEGVTEGEIVEWHVQTGQAVAEDDPMVEVMTDKATVTIAVPKSGRIAETRFSVGDVAPVGDVLVVIETEAAAGASSEAAAPRAPTPPPEPAPTPTPARAPAPPPEPRAAPERDVVASAVGDIRDVLPGTGTMGAPSRPPRVDGGHFTEKPLATPATRKRARELDVDLRRVAPTGAGGRVTQEDVERFAAGPDAAALGTVTSAGDQPASSAQLAVRGLEPIAIRPPTEDASYLEERKPFVGIRRRIAERMQRSKNTAAHFTFVEECDCEALIALRDRMRPRAESLGVKLTYLPFIAKAVVAALRKHPVLNSALDESTNELVSRRYYDLGIAASTDQGLMVPVLRHADRLSLLEMAAEIDRLAEGARRGSLSPAELSGSTFTITSLGREGGLFATPVLNLPEVGILGVHQMKQKPVVKNGEIVIGHVMLLSLSFDHRIVDGHVGAAFAYEIIGLLENPDRLFLEMT